MTTLTEIREEARRIANQAAADVEQAKDRAEGIRLSIAAGAAERLARALEALRD